MARRSLSGKQPAKNIGASPPTRKHVNPETGLVVTEKICPIPHSLKAVDPDGNIITIPLANGYVKDRTSNYGSQITEDKIAAGFLPYAVCPFSPRGELAGSGKKGCEGKFTNEQCCKHITEIALKRRAVKQDKQAKFSQRFETGTDKMVRQLEKQNAMLAKPESTSRKAMPGG